MLVDGPLPADTVFVPRYLSNYDVVLAMYHDQGLPVLKHAGFGHAVNVTLGLPIVRTSVDHGTALDLAGTGRADAGSLVAATRLAIEFADATPPRDLRAQAFRPAFPARSRRAGPHRARASTPQPDQALVEIGPGRGALTERLVGRSRTLDAVEIDRDLAALLRERFGATAGLPNCTRPTRSKFDFAALARGAGSACASSAICPTTSPRRCCSTSPRPTSTSTTCTSCCRRKSSIASWPRPAAPTMAGSP